MKLLILGGTGFLGRHLVQAALDRHHTVTLFHRGYTHPELFPQVEHLHGDREHDLQVLHERRWETVIDSNGQLPRHVRESATMLANSTSHYTFISTTSVYADYTVAPIDEGSPIAHLEDPESSELTPETYGARKALCEHYAEQAMPGRVLVIRPGLIVGPHDPTDRFTYWPHRIAQGGEVLAPGDPEQPVQFIDGRDLAEWTIAMIEARQVGVYNAKGPADPLPLRQFLEQCRDGSGGDATLTWVSEPFLLEHEVVPYVQLPLWVPSTLIGFPRVDCRKAIAAGLHFRPLHETIQDTLTWNATRPTDGPLRAGLTAQHEQQLLREWHQVARS